MSDRLAVASEFANDTDEVHAVMNGVFVGFTAIPRTNRWDEPHYWKFGFLVGRALYILHIVALVALGGVWL